MHFDNIYRKLGIRNPKNTPAIVKGLCLLNVGSWISSEKDEKIAVAGG